MRRSGTGSTWLGIVAAGAAVALLGAACGGTAAGGGAASTSATPSPAGTSATPSPAGTSATPSPAASGAPVADVVQAAPVQHVAVGDLSMGYRVVGPLAPAAAAGTAAGTQTPLLLIMGSSGTMDLWSPALVTALAQDRAVILFDNRGIGETNDPAGAYRFSQLADDTAGLITALGYDKLDILGWSMGADVALDLAVRHPAVVRSLVSYAGDPGGRRALPPTKQALAVLMDTSGSAQKRGERLIELLFPAAYRSANPAYAAAFPIPTEQAKPAAINLQNEALGAWAGVWTGLTSITCPALFVTGTDDVIAPQQNAVMMAARVPGSWLERFAGAGHGLMYQDPQGLAEAVQTFFTVTATGVTSGG